jgi:hypothetical protein
MAYSWPNGDRFTGRYGLPSAALGALGRGRAGPYVDQGMDAHDRMHLVLTEAAALGWKNSIDLAETAEVHSRFSLPGLSPDEVHEALKDARHAGLFAGDPYEGDGSVRTWFQPHLTLPGLQSVGAWPTDARPTSRSWSSPAC